MIIPVMCLLVGRFVDVSKTVTQSDSQTGVSLHMDGMCLHNMRQLLPTTRVLAKRKAEGLQCLTVTLLFEEVKSFETTYTLSLFLTPKIRFPSKAKHNDVPIFFPPHPIHHLHHQ